MRVHAKPEFANWLESAAQQPIDAARMQDWWRQIIEQCGAEPTPHDTYAPALCAETLRRLRQRVFCTLMVRDLSGHASVTEVTEAMSNLADLAVAAAYRSVAHELAAIHGIPHEEDSQRPQEMLIIGMGKLGGCELNVSSDIDLIMLYGDEGETDGRRVLSHHEFYGRLTRRMMPILSEITSAGHVFRTDLRLRPDGDAGPPAWSLDALENYLVSQGREWERYAWLKARPIVASAFDGSCVQSQLEQLDALRRPFVYRKYFDFDALLALRALREQIRVDWNRRSQKRAGDPAATPDNIKLGTGGIREIEFIVQLSQLVRGGRMPALQTPNLHKALWAQYDAGLISEDNAQRLWHAYEFLRQVEHALQYHDDQQTHLLPKTAAGWDGLSAALRYDNAAALRAALKQHRSFVHAMFRDVFHLAGLPDDGGRAAVSGNGGNTTSSEATPTPSTNVETVFVERIHALLPDEAEQLAPRALTIFESPRIKGLPAASRQRLHIVLPAVVDAAAATRAPGAALLRMLDLIETVAQRRVYLTLFAEYPQILARVARMVAASEWVAQYLKRTPLLLDSLIDWSALMEPLDFEQIAGQMRADLDNSVLPDGKPDVERQMNLMRDTQRQVSFHILAQDLEGALTVERVGDLLSLLADIMLEETMRRVWPLVAPNSTTPPRFAIIAYGKLGGKELGYESDLDLVFLFDEDASTLADSETYVRYSRRMVSWLNSMTSSGRLYDVDLRLRPDGDAGLVAASLEGFERYQRQNAWTWEHQALTRARYAVGDTDIGARFETIRREVLLMPRDAATLAQDVRDMRARISAGHVNHSTLFDLKHDSGGMVDVEFVTQYLVLLYSGRHPQLLGNLGNIALLGLAAEAGLIPHELALRSVNAYRTFRREQHALRLQGADKARVDPARFATERAAVIELWEAVFGTTPV